MFVNPSTGVSQITPPGEAVAYPTSPVNGLSTGVEDLSTESIVAVHGEGPAQSVILGCSD